VEGRAALPAEAVDLLPLGAMAPGALEAIAARVSRRVETACHVLPPDELEVLRIPGRDQLDASKLLEALEARVEGDSRVLVGVTGEDIAIPVFTFVFGLARSGGRACVVSLARADPAFYGLPADPDLQLDRTVAEILHELGHLAGLEHCPDRSCLMSFAGSVERVDARGSRFCARCAALLPAWLRGSEPRPEMA
jgi:archaemetzincin